jgi:NAD(P)-dependent dehydrogenase (short-subunit alcohol dehydrogenase family)
MTTLEGRVILVSGVSSGLGRALCGNLAAQGAHVVGIARREIEGRALEEELRSAKGSFNFETGDVSRAEDCERISGICLQLHGRIDVLINNAAIVGTEYMGDVETIPLEGWQRVLDVNLTGSFLMSRAVLPAMRRQADGLVLNIASQAAEWGLDGLAPYSASKAGAVSLARSIAVEGVTTGVRGNAILLGPMRSDAGTSVMAAIAASGAEKEARVPERVSIALPAAAIAESIAVLCLPEARMITGSSITIDQALLAGGAMSRLMKGLATGVAL